MADFIKRLEAQFKGKKTISVDMPTIKIIQAMKEKYSTVYPLFLNTVETIDIPERADLYKELKGAMKRTMELGGILLGDAGRLAKEEEIQEFIDNVKAIETSVSNLYKIFQQSEKLKNKLSAVESQTSMSLETLKNFTSMVSKGISRRASREGGLMAPVGDLGYIGSGVFDAQASLSGKAAPLGGALGLALGPFSPFANAAVSAGYSMYQRAKERRMARQMMGGEIGLMAKQFGISPSDIQQFQDPRSFGTKLQPQFRNPAGFQVDDLFKQYGSAPQGAISQPVRVTEPSALVTGKYTTNTAVAAGLKAFFSEGAFQAPYTKKLMEILEGKQGGFRSGDLFSGLSGQIRRILPWISRFTAALAAGYALYKALGIKLHTKEMVDEIKQVGTEIKQKGVIKALGDEWNRGSYGVFGHSTPSFGENLALGFTGSPSGILAAKLLNQDPDEMAIGLHSRFSGESYEKSKQRIDEFRKFKANPEYRRNLGGAGGTWGDDTSSIGSVVDAIYTLDNQKIQNTELIGAFKELAESKKKESSPSIMTSSSKDNDPFLDYMNMGLLGEDF